MRRRISLSASLAFALAFASTTAASGQLQVFRRGNANLDTGVDISDGVVMLNVLFLGFPDPGCSDARDSNDDGNTDISDASYLLNHLFLGGPQPPAPYEGCGCDPTDDALGCDAATDSCELAPPCDGLPECFGQAALDRAIAENVPPVVCLAPNAAELMAGGLLITVCPAEANSLCNGEPGCAVNFDEVSATLDRDASVVHVMIAGFVDDLVINVFNSQLGTSQDCLVDITFSGEGDVPFVAQDDGMGRVILAEILPLVLDRDSVMIELTASGGVLCTLLAGFQDLFIEDLINQLETSAAELLVDLNAELAGQEFCAED
jgi:hypothetical protein